MINFFKRVFKEDYLIIIIPAAIIVLIIVTLMIYGFSQPKRYNVDEVGSILIEKQISIEEKLINEYQENTHTEDNPFIKLNPYGNAPLSAVLMFETSIETSYLLVISGKTEEADMEYVIEPGTEHFVPIYGLYPETSNTIELFDYDFTNQIVGDLHDTFHLFTYRLDEDTISPSSIETTYEYFGDDLMFVTSPLGSLPAGYDYNGDVRWTLDMDLTGTPQFLQNGHLLVGSNTLISDYNTADGLYEIDLLGKVHNYYQVPGGYNNDFYELGNGNLLVLSNNFDGTIQDVVIEINRLDGRVVKSWDIGDYLPQDQGKAEMWSSSNWFGANSLAYDETTDSIIISGRNQDIIISFGYTSDILNWVIGDPTNWSSGMVNNYFFSPVGEDFEWTYAPGDFTVLPNGDLFIFDNGINRSKNSDGYLLPLNNYSRGVIYHLNIENMEISQIYEYGRTLEYDFYSPYLSGVAYYGENHYMINSGGNAFSEKTGTLNFPATNYDNDEKLETKSTIVEIKDDIVQYKLVLPNNFYKAIRYPLYNTTTSCKFGEPNMLGGQAVTIQYSSKIDEKITLLHNVPPKYEISFAKEDKRFVINGVYDKNDIVYVLLVNDESTLTYQIPTSQEGYAAMHIVELEDGLKQIVFYINEAGIAGEYNVFININGHRYDAYRKVIFK